ncbi:transposase [Waddlia chondrophila 2032/99]|uniref:Transposase n=2 Tax=Waddlia chondrophila TaxID=71667 RepID=F8LC75_9BACT|nr:transposase [Waddlia chondrophila 2032/99]
MKRRKWTPELKTKIVLEGLKGRPLAEICTEYEISQAQFYQWKDCFLNNASRAFEKGKSDQKEARLQKQNNRLKQVVADLTLELKKTTRSGICEEKTS